MIRNRKAKDIKEGPFDLVTADGSFYVQVFLMVYNFLCMAVSGFIALVFQFHFHMPLLRMFLVFILIKVITLIQYSSFNYLSFLVGAKLYVVPYYRNLQSYCFYGEYTNDFMLYIAFDAQFGVK